MRYELAMVRKGFTINLNECCPEELDQFLEWYQRDMEELKRQEGKGMPPLDALYD